MSSIPSSEPVTLTSIAHQLDDILRESVALRVSLQAMVVRLTAMDEALTKATNELIQARLEAETER
jgi:hypothetical protein